MRISDWSSDVCSSDLLAAVSLAWVDGQSLRTYRHAPNTGSRKSWAAGDASSRGVRLALMAQAGEMGYPSVLTAKTWGFYDVSFGGRPFAFQLTYGSYGKEKVLRSEERRVGKECGCTGRSRGLTSP